MLQFMHVYELLLNFIDLLHVSFTFICVLFYVAPPIVQITVKLAKKVKQTSIRHELTLMFTKNY